MERRALVTKFGGASVTPEHRHYVAQRVAQLVGEGNPVVVVVSAMHAGQEYEPYSTDALLELAQSVGPAADLRERDLLLSCGEIISTVLMAHYMRVHYPWPVIALSGGQAGIITDYNYGNASIVASYPEYIRDMLQQGYVVLVAGFQGVTEAGESRSGVHGAITTLGRGGGDATACALGYALEAQRVDIYTEVPGVMTADPGLFEPGAAETPYPLARVTYEDVCEMAHLGAKVMQARAAEIALVHRVPLRIASTWEDCPGTYVVSGEGFAGPAVTAVANSARVFPVEFEVEREEDKREVEIQIMRALGEAGISVYLVHSRPNGCSFVVEQEALEPVKDLLYGLVMPLQREGHGRYYVMSPWDARPQRWQRLAPAQLQARVLREGVRDGEVREVPLQFGEPASIVSVIGPGLRDQVGVAAAVISALEERGLEVCESAESSNSLSCLVSEHDLPAAVQALHRRLVVERALG